MPRRALLLLSLLAVLATPALSAPRFHVVNLGIIPGGTSSAPYHFGTAGSVVGWSDIPGTFGGHATRWSFSPSGAWLATDDLGGLEGFDWSAACAMNAAGWIVGYSNTADPQPRAVLWRAGQLLDIERGADGNANIYALDVNDSGTICGFLTKSGGGGGWDGAIWVERPGQPGRFDRTLLPLPASADPLNSWNEAQSIDESGRVFGRTNLGLEGDRATLWEADAAHTPILLEPLAGSLQSMPGACNDLGDAVGYTMHAFGLDVPTRWSRDATHTPSALPVWPGHNAGRAIAVSPSGDVVFGFSDLIDPTRFPFSLIERRVVMWAQSGLWDLNQQLDTSSGAGWNVVSANDTNADGWVAAVAESGGVQRAVLLLPVPENLAVDPAPRAGLVLSAPWPNPMRGEVTLGFTLDHEQDIRLRIMDAQGRQIARLAAGRHPAGRHRATWSGRDDHDQIARAGLYYALLEAGTTRTARAIIRVQ